MIMASFTSSTTGGTVIKGKVAALVFEPPFYRTGVQALPQTAKTAAPV